MPVELPKETMPYNEREIAHRRMCLAIMEIGSCLTDIANLLIKNMNGPDTEFTLMQRGGIAIGLERAVVALRNQSWNEFYTEEKIKNQTHPLKDPFDAVLHASTEMLLSAIDGNLIDQSLITNLKSALQVYGRCKERVPWSVNTETGELEEPEEGTL